MVLAQPKPAQADKALAKSLAQPVEQYTPPPLQHAGATLPLEVRENDRASDGASGVFLQVGAFANPDAAQLLKDKLSGMTAAPVFISSVVHQQQVLHRVRLGPINSLDEASRLEQSVRLANLGQPRRVKAD